MESKEQGKRNAEVVKRISDIPSEDVKGHEGFSSRALLALREKEAVIRLINVRPGGVGPVPPHRHDDAHFFLVLEGTLGLEIDGHLYTVENGSCAEVLPGCTHQLRCIGRKEMKLLAIKWT